MVRISHKSTSGLALSILLPLSIPITHAQIAQESAHLIASDTVTNDLFGWAVAIDGDTAVVTAPLHDHQGRDSGSAFVFVREGDGWIEQAELLPADGLPGDHAGQNTVALDGDTVLLGAHRHPKNGETGVGAVFVFEREGTRWRETAKIVAADGAPGDQFGVAVELQGDTAVIGANGDRNPGATRGSVYVFVREGDNWSQQARLFSERPESGYTGFGERIALDGDVLAAGAFSTHTQGYRSGSVNIFEREGDSWQHTAHLIPDDGESQDQFAIVALSGDTLLVGACRCHQAEGGGFVYVFERTDGTWVQQQVLFPLDDVPLNHFGVSIAMAKNRAVIGAPGESDGREGTAYLFSREAGTWTQRQKILPSISRGNDKFGARVAMDESSILIGARGDLDLGILGSAFLFDHDADFEINPGLNDAWFDPDTAGQGFFVNVFADTGLVFLAWFTYDTERPPDSVRALIGEPGHRWLTAVGPFDGKTATLEVTNTTGGLFDRGEPVPVNDSSYGSIILSFQDCRTGFVDYDLPGPGLSGSISLRRIVEDNVALCEALATSPSETAVD